MRVLVTGGLGFIGGHVVQRFLAEGFEVRVVDSLDETVRDPTDRLKLMEDLKHPNLEIFQGNLSDFVSQEKFKLIDVVVHAAASVGLAKGWVNPDLYFANNVGQTQVLADALRAHESIKIVHLSTSSVYGQVAVGGEDEHLDPCSPYGESKLLAEQVWVQDKAFVDRVSILRLFSVYGPRQRPDMVWSRFIEQAISSGMVTITGGGEQSRSFTHVHDVVRAIQLAADASSPVGIYNICGNKSATLNEGVEILENLLGFSLSRNYITRPPGDQERTQGDGDLARNQLKFQPEISLNLGLADQLSKYLESHNK